MASLAIAWWARDVLTASPQSHTPNPSPQYHLGQWGLSEQGCRSPRAGGARGPARGGRCKAGLLGEPPILEQEAHLPHPLPRRPRPGPCPVCAPYADSPSSLSPPFRPNARCERRHPLCVTLPGAGAVGRRPAALRMPRAGRGGASPWAGRVGLWQPRSPQALMAARRQVCFGKPG